MLTMRKYEKRKRIFGFSLTFHFANRAHKRKALFVFCFFFGLYKSERIFRRLIFSPKSTNFLIPTDVEFSLRSNLDIEVTDKCGSHFQVSTDRTARRPRSVIGFFVV
jgi:hypothetical protein